MVKRVSRALPLALVVLVVFSGVALAGPNAGVGVSISQDSFSGVAADGTVEFAVSVTGLAGLKSFAIGLQFDTPAAFDVTQNATPGIQFAPIESLNFGGLLPGISAFEPGNPNKVLGGGGTLSGPFLSGDADLGIFTASMAADYDGSQATMTIFEITLVDENNETDVFTYAYDEQLGITITVNPPLPPPTITGIDPSAGSSTGGNSATITGTEFQDGATVTIGGNDAGAAFVSSTELTATVPAGAVGTADVVVTNPDATTATLAGGFTYVPVIIPTLLATTATDASRDYSSLGAGDIDDGSAGEATFGVRFTDDAGGAAAGQEILWSITNNGEKSVFLVSSGDVLEIPANNTIAAGPTTTGADGSASATFDSEGAKGVGTTSMTVSASTSATDSEGATRALSISFSATWDVPVAAELASISGQYTLESNVVIEWAVASQSNNLGWEVYRSTDQIRFEQVGDLIPGDGTIDDYRLYDFMDLDLPAVDVVYYYLKQLDLDGKTGRSEVIEVSLNPPLPSVSALLQNFPNPFNPETAIGFDLAEESIVSITIYDMTGQVVQRLVDAHTMSAGHHSVVWDGLNSNANKVSSGVYFYQLETPTLTSMRKMTLLQ